MTLTLRLDQQADLAWMFANPKGLLLHSPGVGKTPTVCVKQYARWKEGKKTIWVMPKSLLSKNKRELHSFTPFTDEQVVIVDGPKASQLMKSPEGVVFLMGPDRFRLCADNLPEDIKAFDVDEFHMAFGGATSARTKAWMKHASKKDVETIVMTGTLINGRLDTAWSAIHAIEPKYYPLGHDQFLAQHAILDEYDRPVAWRNHSKLSKILSRHGIRRTFEDVFGKQTVVLQLEDDIQMSPIQREMYDELESTAVLDLESVMVDGTMPGVQLIRCRQILEHPEAFPAPDGIRNLLGNEMSGKEERLRIHLEDHARTGDPVILYSALRPQQEHIAGICAQMGIKVGLMNSKTSGPQRAKIDIAFQAGELQAIVSSDKIASVGFNWQFWGPKKQEVGHIINVSLGFMDGDFIQGQRRAIRQKRSTPLRHTVLAYADCAVEDRQREIITHKSIDANKVDPTREVIKFR